MKKTALIFLMFLCFLSAIVLYTYKYEKRLKNLFPFSLIIKQRSESRMDAQIHLINNNMVDSYELLYNCQKGTCDGSLDKYIRYFQLIRDFIPAQADSYALLGFCYAHSGDIRKAISYYEKSLVINRNFFWSYWNLGLLLWSKGDYLDAAALMSHSLELNPMDTLQTLLAAKIYSDMIITLKDPTDISINLKKAAKQEVIFLEMMQKGEKAPEPLPLRLF